MSVLSITNEVKQEIQKTRSAIEKSNECILYGRDWDIDVAEFHNKGWVEGLNYSLEVISRTVAKNQDTVYLVHNAILYLYSENSKQLKKDDLEKMTEYIMDSYGRSGCDVELVIKDYHEDDLLIVTEPIDGGQGHSVDKITLNKHNTCLHYLSMWATKDGKFRM